jgi:hypothetical protein
MKSVMNFFIIAALCCFVFSFTSCDKDSGDASTGNVKFSLDLGSSLKSGSLADSSGTNDSITGYYAIITLKDNLGAEVVSSKRLQIFTFGGSYVSESITLEEGNYTLSEFIIVKGSDAKYVSPLEGSERAPLVSRPLPLLFQVTKNGNTVVLPQVLKVNSDNPSEFGYTSFDFTIIETMVFKIAVFDTISSDSLQASLLVSFYKKDSAYSDSINTYKTLSYNLKSHVNTIEVNKASTYLLSVSKNGYYSWNKQYSEQQLGFFKNNPLRVYLRKIAGGDSIFNHRDSVYHPFFPPTDTIYTPKDSVR